MIDDNDIKVVNLLIKDIEDRKIENDLLREEIKFLRGQVEYFQNQNKDLLNILSQDQEKIIVTVDMVDKVREKTLAPMMECKKALIKTNGNPEEAVTLLKNNFIRRN